MGRLFGLLIAVLAAVSASPAQALVDTFIEVKLDRQKDGQPVFQRAILSTPDGRTPETVLLFFRGGHGVAMLNSIEDRRTNTSLWFGPNLAMFMEANIATAVVGCPTDEWGPVEGNKASSCLDTYRASERHANDVRTIIDHLKSNHGIKNVFIIGHSKGTLSSRWLAVNLGNEIAGSIHSASMSQPDPYGNGRTLSTLPYEKITAPAVWLHHERDACETTKYSDAVRRSGGRLITVRGGKPTGEPCVNHYHGYDGRGPEAVRAVITWIQSGTVTRYAGEP